MLISNKNTRCTILQEKITRRKIGKITKSRAWAQCIEGIDSIKNNLYFLFVNCLHQSNKCDLGLLTVL